MLPVSDLPNTVPQPSKFTFVYTAANTSTFFRLFVAVTILFFQVSSFLELSKTVILASKLPSYCWRDFLLSLSNLIAYEKISHMELIS